MNPEEMRSVAMPEPRHRCAACCGARGPPPHPLPRAPLGLTRRDEFFGLFVFFRERFPRVANLIRQKTSTSFFAHRPAGRRSHPLDCCAAALEFVVFVYLPFIVLLPFISPPSLCHSRPSSSAKSVVDASFFRSRSPVSLHEDACRQSLRRLSAAVLNFLLLYNGVSEAISSPPAAVTAARPAGLAESRL